TEKVCLRAGRQHQKVALVLLPLGCVHRMRVEIDRDDLCHLHVNVAMALKRAAQIESYVAWTEHRGGHLVQQRLELLVVVLVKQRDPKMRMRCQLAGTLQSGETTTYDQNVLHAVRLGLGGGGHSCSTLTSANKCIGNDATRTTGKNTSSAGITRSVAAGSREPTREPGGSLATSRQRQAMGWCA